MEKLTTTNWIAIAAILATCLLTLFAHYLLYVWHTPDVRYETGAYYRSGDIAVTSLKL